jgi:hypothetical protein
MSFWGKDETEEDEMTPQHPPVKWCSAFGISLSKVRTGRPMCAYAAGNFY